MKAYRFFIPCFILLVFLVSFLVISDAEASDLCWEASDPDGKAIARLGVLNIGGGHFLLSGRVTNPGGEIDIIHGNAEIEGNNILMTLTSSGKNSIAMWTGIDHWVLDRSTLNGTWEAIGNDHNYSDQPFISGDIFIDSDTEYDTGTVTNIPCP